MLIKYSIGSPIFPAPLQLPAGSYDPVIRPVQTNEPEQNDSITSGQKHRRVNANSFPCHGNLEGMGPKWLQDGWGPYQPKPGVSVWRKTDIPHPDSDRTGYVSNKYIFVVLSR